MNRKKITVFLLVFSQLVVSADCPFVQQAGKVTSKALHQGCLDLLGGACRQWCNRDCCSCCGCDYFTRRNCFEAAGMFVGIGGMSVLIAKGVVAVIANAVNAPGEGGHGQSYFDDMQK